MARNGMVVPASDTPVLHAPWDFETTELSEGMCSTVYDARGTMVADYLTEDRARLIAAAPELLEAARDMLGAFEAIAADIGTDVNGPCPAHDIDLCGEPICSASGCVVWRVGCARAAIAKATAPSPTPHTRPDDKSTEGSHGSD